MEGILINSQYLAVLIRNVCLCRSKAHILLLSVYVHPFEGMFVITLYCIHWRDFLDCTLLRNCIIFVCVVQKVRHLQSRECRRLNQHHTFVFFFASLAHVSRVCSAWDFVALVCFGNLKAEDRKEQRQDLRESRQGCKKKNVFVSKSNQTHLRLWILKEVNVVASLDQNEHRKKWLKQLSKANKCEAELGHFFAGDQWESKEINFHRQRPETQA